jgi:uncharacterized sulfatase
MKLCRFLAPLLAVSALSVVSRAADRPNILFIMADDQGPWTTSVSGQKQIRTPAMDRIANEGARFTHALTPTPVCSPARASILTSRYGSEFGILDWINPNVDKGLGLPDGVLTWPRLLQQSGYATALIGKWHVGDLDSQHPTQRGYETFVGFRGGGNTPRNPTIEKNGVTAKREGFIVDIVADETIAWLKQLDRSKPFAASVHFREPHAPYLPVRDEDWAKVKDLDPVLPEPDLPGLDVPRTKRLIREYLASIIGLDRNIGRILATLDELGLAANTLVLCTSDHGYNIGQHGLIHKGNAKWLLVKDALPPGTANVPTGERPNMFDTSLHVPMAIRWPAAIKPGTVVAHTISHLDWLPTFAALAGRALPAGTIVRGRDITHVLRGTAQNWDESFYAEYSMRHGAKVHMRTLRTPEWKLTRDFNNEGRDELYHLTADPGEKQNLIASADPAAKKALADLDARILAKMTELKDATLPLARQRLAR